MQFVLGHLSRNLAFARFGGLEGSLGSGTKGDSLRQYAELNPSGGQGLNSPSLQDRSDDSAIALSEIDPLTFLSSSNREITDANRRENWQFLKEVESVRECPGRFRRSPDRQQHELLVLLVREKAPAEPCRSAVGRHNRGRPGPPPNRR
jgi:hypothetical protein